MPADFLDEIFSEDSKAAAAAHPADASVAKLKTLADELEQLEREIADLDHRIGEKQKRAFTVATRELPDLMQDLGVASYSLTDGTKLSVLPEYYASITEGNREAAHKWLRDNGYSDIIKNEFKVGFGKGDDAEAANFAELVKSAGFSYEQKESVHYQTLRAFVKEQIESGKPISMELLGAHVLQRARITRPKERKKQ